MLVGIRKISKSGYGIIMFALGLALLGGFLGGSSAAVAGLTAGAIVTASFATVLAGVSLGYTIGSTLDAITMGTPEVPQLPSPTYSDRRPHTLMEEGIRSPLVCGLCAVGLRIVRNQEVTSNRLAVLGVLSEGEIDSVLATEVNEILLDDLIEKTHYHDVKEGTASQSVLQLNGSDIFDTELSAFRGFAIHGFSLHTGQPEIGTSIPSFIDYVRGKKWEPIGGGTDAWSMNPAEIAYGYYRTKRGKETTDLDTDAFNSLKTWCETIPTDSESYPIRPAGPSADTVKAHTTSSVSGVFGMEKGSSLEPRLACDPTLPIRGTRVNNEWVSAGSGDQRFNVDLGGAVALDKIRIVNSHDANDNKGLGIKDFDIQGSNDPDALAQTNPGSDTYWTNVATGLVASIYDVNDPYETIDVGGTTAYRYYSLKITSTQTAGKRKGIRDLEFWVISPRRTFNYVFDNDIKGPDAVKQIARSFDGTFIKGQDGKIKPVWESNQEADGSGGLQPKAVIHTFNLDNIVQGSFKYWKPQRSNSYNIRYLDQSNLFVKAAVTIKDAIDIEDRGEVPYQEDLYWCTYGDQAARIAEQMRRDSLYCDYWARLTGLPDSGKVDLYDLVKVTHARAGFDEKEFLVVKRDENDLGEITFTLKAYHEGIYSDKTVPFKPSYRSRLNRYLAAPQGVTSTAVSNRSYFDASGNYVRSFSVTWTEPDNQMNFDHVKLQWGVRNDGAATCSTVDDFSTTVTFGATDYGNLTVGDIVTANSESVIIVSKDGSNECTVYPSVNWYNAGSGYSHKYITFADVEIHTKPTGASAYVDGNNLSYDLGDTLAFRVIPISPFGVRAAIDPGEYSTCSTDISDLGDLIDNLGSDTRKIILPDGTYTWGSGGYAIATDVILSILGESRHGVKIQNSAGDDGVTCTDFTGYLKLGNLTLESVNTSSYSSMVNFDATPSAGTATGDLEFENITILLEDGTGEGISGMGYDKGINVSETSGHINLVGVTTVGGSYGIWAWGDANGSVYASGCQFNGAKAIGAFLNFYHEIIANCDARDSYYKGFQVGNGEYMLNLTGNTVRTNTAAENIAGAIHVTYDSSAKGTAVIEANNVFIKSTDADGEFKGMELEQLDSCNLKGNHIYVSVVTSGDAFGMFLRGCEKCSFDDYIKVDNSGSGNNKGMYFTNSITY